ncbi:unnamed protein product, partial [Ectocarpus sp. 4 AP-2014]
DAVCCAVDGCEDNEALNDLLACINAESTCSVDIGDCAADGSRGISDSDTTTDTDDAVIDTTTDTDGTASDTTTDTDGTASDAITDTDSAAADDTSDAIPFPVGDDEEDDEDSDADADAANTESSATSAAAMGSSTAVWLIAAAAPSLWRRF